MAMQHTPGRGGRSRGLVSTAVALAIAALALCPSSATAERLYFLARDGLHSVLTSGAGDVHHATWEGADASCALNARGFGVDELDGWATVSCERRFFKIKYMTSEPNPRWTEVKFDNRKIFDFYGTAINTKTHVAYVAAFETGGWRVKGHLLKGCETLKEEAACKEYSMCKYNKFKGCVYGEYQDDIYVSEQALDPFGGGLFADEDNTIWFSFTHDVKGGLVVGKPGGSKVTYPRVADTFPAITGAAVTQEIGYPMMINQSLYLLSVEDQPELKLYRYRATTQPEVIHSALPRARGGGLNVKAAVRQPSFAMVDQSRLLYVRADGNAIMQATSVPCTTEACFASVTTVIEKDGIGPLFYRLLPKETTDAPTDLPATDVPTTDAPPGATPEPAAGTTTPEPGTPPTPAPPGATPAPGTPPATASPAGGNVTAAAPPPDKRGLDIGELILILGLCSVACCLCGVTGGYLYFRRKKRRKTERMKSPESNPTEPMLELTARTDKTPPSPLTIPGSTPLHYHASHLTFPSDSLIHNADLHDLHNTRRIPTCEVRGTDPYNHSGSPMTDAGSTSGGGTPLRTPSGAAAAGVHPKRRGLAVTYDLTATGHSQRDSHPTTPTAYQADVFPRLGQPKERFRSVTERLVAKNSRVCPLHQHHLCAALLSAASYTHTHTHTQQDSSNASMRDENAQTFIQNIVEATR